MHGAIAIIVDVLHDDFPFGFSFRTGNRARLERWTRE